MASFAKTTNIIGLSGCVLALLYAFVFLGNYLGLEPCPLCILDRIVVVLMGLVFLAGVKAESVFLRLGLSGANVVFLALGLLLAGRHVWLQNQPVDDAHVCLADSETAKSLTELVGKAFGAGADCQLIMWEFAGLSIPMQVLLMFVGFAAVVLAQLCGIFHEIKIRGKQEQ